MRRVVVTGAGIISPLGNHIDSFIHHIFSGTCGIGFISRYDTTENKVKIAAEVKDFNPELYGMSTNEDRRMDLYSRYAIAAAVQAAEMSGIVGTVDDERFGVYVGSGIGGMQTLIDETTKMIQHGPRRISPLFIPKMIGNIASGNIAIRFHAQGPNLPTVTACATSTHDIGEAYRAIAHGYADAILAGGAEASINALAIAGFTSCMALSTSPDPLAASLPFDARRKGFVIGEGAAVIVLEEYERAKARGAEILCEMVGYANTCDAYHVTAPDPEAAQSARAIAEAAKQAGFAPGQKLYINAHGTGTPLNDVSETLAIKKALGDEAYKAQISSTKSMTGHMLGAAGAAEAICAIYALYKGVIPPTIGYQEKDEGCDLDYVPNAARQEQADIALSISLGFGGHNGCLAFKKI